MYIITFFISLPCTVKFKSPVLIIYLIAIFRGRMHKSSCGHLSKRRSNSPWRVLENKFIFTNLLSNGICMMPEAKKVVWLILIIINMSMASTSGFFFLQNCWSSFCLLHKMELNWGNVYRISAADYFGQYIRFLCSHFCTNVIFYLIYFIFYFFLF